MTELIITIAIQLATAIFVYGKLTQKVDGHEKRLDTNESMLTRHEGEIGELYGMAGATRAVKASQLPSPGSLNPSH